MKAASMRLSHASRGKISYKKADCTLVVATLARAVERRDTSQMRADTIINLCLWMSINGCSSGRSEHWRNRLNLLEEVYQG